MGLRILAGYWDYGFMGLGILGLWGPFRGSSGGKS